MTGVNDLTIALMKGKVSSLTATNLQDDSAVGPGDGAYNVSTYALRLPIETWTLDSSNMVISAPIADNFLVLYDLRRWDTTITMSGTFACVSGNLKYRDRFEDYMRQQNGAVTLFLPLSIDGGGTVTDSTRFYFGVITKFSLTQDAGEGDRFTYQMTLKTNRRQDPGTGFGVSSSNTQVGGI